MKTTSKSGAKPSTDEAIKGAPGWYVTSKECFLCEGPIHWHYQKGDRDLKEPLQNACVECDEEGWGFPCH